MRHIFFLSLLSIFVGSCRKETIPTISTGPVNFELVWKERFSKNKVRLFSIDPVLTPNNGIAFLKMFDGPEDIITCRDRTTGQKKWSWQDPIDIYDGEKVSEMFVYENKLGIGSSHEMNVVDINSGQTIWKTDVQTEGFSGMPRSALINNQIYHTRTINPPNGDFAELFRTNINQGNWESLFTVNKSENNDFASSFESYAIWKNPQTGDSILLFQNRQTQFFAHGKSKVDLFGLNLRTRQVEWKIDSIDYEGNSSVSPILVLGDKAYFMGMINLFCIDPAVGKVVWKKHFNQGDTIGYSETFLHSKLVAVNNMLIVKPALRKMYAFDLQTGAEIWRSDDGCKGSSDTQVYKDWIFIPSQGEGDVWVHRISDGKLVTRLRSPHHNSTEFPNAYIATPIAIDQATGYLYCTDGYFIMCFKIKTE